MRPRYFKQHAAVEQTWGKNQIDNKDQEYTVTHARPHLILEMEDKSEQGARQAWETIRQNDLSNYGNIEKISTRKIHPKEKISIKRHRRHSQICLCFIELD